MIHRYLQRYYVTIVRRQDGPQFTERRRWQCGFIPRYQLGSSAQGLYASFLPTPSWFNDRCQGWPSSFDRSSLCRSSRKYIRPAVKLSARLASNLQIRIEGTINLVVLLANPPALVTFGYVDNLVLPILLRISYQVGRKKRITHLNFYSDRLASLI